MALGYLTYVIILYVSYWVNYISTNFFYPIIRVAPNTAGTFGG